MTQDTNPSPIQMPDGYHDGWVEAETLRIYAARNKEITCGNMCRWDAALGRFVPEAGCPEHDPAEGGKVP
jgi:hypothetical protein